MNRNRLITLACYFAFIALGVCVTLLGPTFQQLTQRFGVSLDNAGIFTGAQYASASLSLLITGQLLDRVNARYLLAGGVLLMGGGLILLSVAESLPVALLATVLLGLGVGAIDVAPNVVVAALNPNNMTASLNALNLYWGIGAMLGPQVVSLALRLENFRVAYLITGLVTIVLVIPFWSASVPPRTTQNGLPGGRLNIRILLPFLLTTFLYSGLEVGFSNWLVTQMSKVALAPEAIATLGVSAYFLGLTISRGVAGSRLQKLKDGHLMMTSATVLFLGVLLLLLFPTIALVSIISAFIAGLGSGPVFPTTFSIAARVHPQSLGMASGILIALGTVGSTVWPWFQGKVGAGLNGGMIVPLFGALILLGMSTYISRARRYAA